jgi:hypothetical protein
MCLIAEIIHTCSHEKVAHAAVASMGACFAGRVGVTAGAHGLSIGAFTARVVQEFGKSSGEAEKDALRRVMDGSDHPILTGLQHILLPAIEGKGLRGGSSPVSAGGKRRPHDPGVFLTLSQEGEAAAGGVCAI